MIQPQQLRVLVAIRDHGSLTAAAAAMGYGVPTIAHHLGALERHFKVRFVERDRRGARLTPLGAALVVEADQILARLDQAERLVRAQRDVGLTTLRIGTFASIGSQLLPRAIRELRERLPVQVEVIEAEPTSIVSLLDAGEIHAGLIYDSAEEPTLASADLEFDILLEEPYRLLVARDSSLAGLAVVDLAALVGADWICSRSEGEASDRVLRRTCRSVGYEPNVLMRTDDLNMIHGLVAEGIGITLMTEAATDTRFAVELRPTVQGLGLRRTSFVRHRGSAPGAVVELHHILVTILADRVGFGQSPQGERGGLGGDDSFDAAIEP